MWLEACLITLIYVAFGAALVAVLLHTCKPPRLRAPRLLVDPLTLTTDSENWGLY